MTKDCVNYATKIYLIFLAPLIFHWAGAACATNMDRSAWSKEKKHFKSYIEPELEAMLGTWSLLVSGGLLTFSLENPRCLIL